MTKKISRIVAMILLAGAVCFLIFALGHPEMSFPWSNSITYALYALYILLVILFTIAPFKKK